MLSYEDWYLSDEGQKVYKSLGYYKPQYVNAKMQSAYKAYVSQYTNDAFNKLRTGETSALDFQGQYAGEGLNLTPEQVDYMNNMISKQNVDAANAFTEKMRDSSLTSSANQLSSLGLNPSSVIQAGGSGIGSSPVADSSNANSVRDNALRDFDRKSQITNTLLGIAGKVASAGIYGGVRATLGRTIGQIASSTANSARSAMSYSRGTDPDLIAIAKTNIW